MTPSLASTWPAMPAMRNLRPLRSSTVLISLRNQPPICAQVLPAGDGVDVVALVEIVEQLLAAALRQPRIHLARVEAERHRRCPARRSDPCRRNSRRRCGPSRPCRSARRRAPAGRARSRPRRRCGSGTCCRSSRPRSWPALGAAAQRVERLGKARGQAPVDLGRDWAMAGAAIAAVVAVGAAPTPAVRRNLRRCMSKLPIGSVKLRAYDTRREGRKSPIA